MAMLIRRLSIFCICLLPIATINADLVKPSYQLQRRQLMTTDAQATPTALATMIAVDPSPPQTQISTATPTDSTNLSPTDAASSSEQEYNSGYPDNGEAWSNLPTSSSFGNTVYAGAATFVTPTKSKSMYPLYPIQSNANVTFKWGYTALRVRPVSLTLNAVGPNSITYGIANLNGSATEATWNLASVPTETPLMMGYYKVQLYDQRGLSVDYSPGWMMPCTTLSVGFYAPDTYDPYTTLDNYCPMCFYNAGSSIRENLGPILGTLGIAVLTSVIVLLNIFSN